MPTALALDSKKADDGQRRLRSDSSQSSGLAFSKVNRYTDQQACAWAIWLVRERFR